MRSPKVSVVSVILRNRSIVLVKRRDHPFPDRWSLPGGHLKFGEELSEAIKREVLEETSLSIKIEGLMDFKNQIISDESGEYHYIIFCFKAGELEGNLRAGGDAKETRWVDLENLSEYKISPMTKPFLNAAGKSQGSKRTS